MSTSLKNPLRTLCQLDEEERALEGETLPLPLPSYNCEIWG